VVIAWLALGLVVLLVMKLTGKEDWISQAGRVAEERVETDEEAGHRPMF
jgi:hypothetical protein